MKKINMKSAFFSQDLTPKNCNGRKFTQNTKFRLFCPWKFWILKESSLASTILKVKGLFLSEIHSLFQMKDEFLIILDQGWSKSQIWNLDELRSRIFHVMTWTVKQICSRITIFDEFEKKNSKIKIPNVQIKSFQNHQNILIK